MREDARRFQSCPSKTSFHDWIRMSETISFMVLLRMFSAKWYNEKD